MSRLLAVVVVIAAVLAAGYFTLRESKAPPSTTDTPKDIAAVFASVQGNVKTRGVGGLDWKTAEARTPLRKSDLVRTYPSSSAEIKFFDDTLVTVRPDSLITIEETSRDPDSSSSKVAWKVTSGEINYETTQRGGSTEAVTPTFRLALEGNSAGTMRVGETGITAVAQISGSASIQTKSGEKIRLTANEGLKVDASGKAGAKQVLPNPPALEAPGKAGLVSLDLDDPVVLSWTPSAGAASYRVQVESRAGAEGTVFNGDGLKGTSVNVPGIAAGEFAFRVAGLTGDGVQGKFSAPVAFRVERVEAERAPVTSAPPVLIIEAFEARSNVVRLAGKTEPGARLTVNGAAVPVQSDGTFKEFVTLARRQGEQRVVIRATSLNGGVAEETRTLPPGQ